MIFVLIFLAKNFKCADFYSWIYKKQFDFICLCAIEASRSHLFDFMNPSTPVPKLGLTQTKSKQSHARIIPNINHGNEIEIWQKIMNKEDKFLQYEEHLVDYQSPFHFFTKDEYQKQKNIKKQKVS